MRASFKRLSTRFRCEPTHPCKQLTHLLLLSAALLAFTLPAWSQATAVAAIAIDPAAPTTLYAGTPIGVFKSTDGGATWSLPTAAMIVSSLAIDPGKPSTIYTNAYRSVDGGSTWAEFTRPGPGATVLVVDPNQPSTLYAGGRGNFAPTMFRSLDAGVTWHDFSQGLAMGTPPHTEYRTILSLAVDPQTSTLFAGTVIGGSFGAIGRRLQSAPSWQVSPTSSSSLEILDIVIHPSNSQFVYAAVRSLSGNARGVLKSVDGGTNWNYNNVGLPSLPNANAIAIDPALPSTLYVGLNSGIFKSIDGGETWTASGTGFASGAVVNALVVDPVTPGVVYAGTSVGVYKSTDHGASWIESNKGLHLGSTVPAPKLASFSPAGAPQDSFIDVTIAGAGFASPFGLNFGRGISVLAATIHSATTMTAQIQVAANDAVLGARDVTLITANGTSNGLPFTVTPGTQVPPNIASVSPAFVWQGTTATVKLAGTNFTPSMSGTISGIDVTLSSMIVLSPTSATAVISAGPTSPVSSRSLQLSTPFGGSGSGFAFDVAQGSPVISSMSPPFVLESHTTTVTFAGIRLVPPLTFVTDPDIRIDNISTDASWTSATVSITVPLNAALGVHSLRVVSGGLQSSVHKFMVRSLTRHADFDGYGNADLLWYNAATGETEMRLMNGINVLETVVLLRDPQTRVTATGDFDGNGKTDLVWCNPGTGQTSIWLMNGTRTATTSLTLTVLPGAWSMRTTSMVMEKPIWSGTMETSARSS
jgi:hypothetical protein